MIDLAHVTVHPSQFPDRIKQSLIESLRARRVNHKFHYDSVKQTQKWLALHEAYSPARTDPDAQLIYDHAFVAAVKSIRSKRVHLIGLGCGGGKKDTRLLQLLAEAGKEVWYTPVDVSTAMTLVARQTALPVVSPGRCFPLVCDLADADEMAASLAENLQDPDVFRLITFFGMLPNFEPNLILPKLAAVVGADDLLLVSANLAPGRDYHDGVGKILPLYDNHLTREWLLTFLLDLGVERSDGDFRFVIEPGTVGGLELFRVAAYFHFSRTRLFQIDQEQFEFKPGETIRLFFSYRHTPGLVRSLFMPNKLHIQSEWVTKSGEEGVFVCGRGN